MQRVRLPLSNMRVDSGVLFRLRTGAGITQKVVAERALISEHWYRKIEHGDVQPSLPVAQSIAHALGCKLAAFCVSTVTGRAA